MGTKLTKIHHKNVKEVLKMHIVVRLLTNIKWRWKGFIQKQPWKAVYLCRQIGIDIWNLCCH